MRSMLHNALVVCLGIGTLLTAPMATAFLSADAIPISSIEELQLIGNEPAYPQSADYFLTNDIDASVTATWNPDGNGGFSGFEPVSFFTGRLDGRGYIISGLYINRPSDERVGLFRNVGTGAYLANFSVTGALVSGDEEIGILAGRLAGNISNIHVEGSVTGTSINAGAFAGYISGASTIVEACTAEGTVNGVNQAGGFAGSIAFGADVRRCSTSTAVSGVDTVGGFAGRINNDVSVSQCFATGMVTGTDRAGGFAGELLFATIDNAYANGDVTGDTIVGGFVGQGGLSASIVNAYSSGLVEGETDTGGFHGAGAIAVTNCFWDEDTAGVSSSFSGEGRSTAQMQATSTFDSLWEFGSVWELVEGKSYPFLIANEEFPLPGIADLIEISIYNELQLIGVHEAYSLDAYYALSNDIEAPAGDALQNGDEFEPIGTDALPFTGVFDGRGRHIRNLTIDSSATDNVGFIGVLGAEATVRRLGLSGGTVSGGNNTGALVGHNQGGYVVKCFSALPVEGLQNTGGLVGLNEGTIAYSYATGDVVGTQPVGGLVGDNTAGTLYQTYAAGNVSGAAAVGGLTGLGDGATESYWDSTTSGAAASGGGSPLETNQMRLEEYFAPAWDFDAVWDIIEFKTYPFLRSNIQDPLPGALPIYTIEELQLIGSSPDYPINRYYYLANDIDASDTATWNLGAGFAPIGAVSNSFSGTLDGRGHTISGLHIERPATENVGLFGYISLHAVIKDIGIVDAHVSGQNNVGILAGNMFRGELNGVYVTGTVTATGNNAGGLIGEKSSAVGVNFGEIEACYAIVTVDGTDNVGGLVGRNRGATIRQSYASGSVSGNSSVGGLVGFSEGGILDCYSNATVSANQRGGGLVGNLMNGGIHRSLATGQVNSGPPAGGIAANYGFINQPTVRDTFWDTITTGQSTSNDEAQSTGLPTNALKQRDTYEPPWNLFEIWGIADGLSYPYLRNISFVLTGLVTYQDGTPLPNAVVFSDLDGFETLTNEAGEFALVLPAPYTGAISIDSELPTVPAMRVYTDQRESLSFQSFVVYGPTIALLGDEEMIIACGDIYEEPGATAEDGDANDISGFIVVTGSVDTTVPGTYTVFYDVEDAFGIAAVTKIRTVQVVDNVPPVIELIGPAILQLECGSSFVDPGASALDACDGVVSVLATGTVDTSTPGAYEIQYTASDASENEATPLSRTVTIVDTTVPVVVLNGSATMTLECGEMFTDPLAEVTDNCDLVELDVSGEVDTTTPGTYTIFYSAVDSSNNVSETVERTVNVVDTTAPVVVLNGSATMEIECGDGFTDPLAEVTDTCDEVDLDISGEVDTSTAGTYTVFYSAVDSAGNEAETVSRTVTVIDTTAPTVQLEGAATIEIECGSVFSDPGAAVFDNCDAEAELLVSGTVDTEAPGDYTITYQAIDASGNESEVITRQVNVVDTAPPVITLNGSEAVTISCREPFDDPGATAEDACDSALQVVVTGTVDTHQAGIYTVDYTATDAAGNTGMATRTITVLDDCGLPIHSGDTDGNGIVSLSELLRVIQFFNIGAYHCAATPDSTEDGYLPGANTNAQSCIPHASDYNPQDWQINLSELLRLIQFFNTGAYHECPDANPPTEDGYCPGPPPETQES